MQEGKVRQHAVRARSMERRPDLALAALCLSKQPIDIFRSRGLLGPRLIHFMPQSVIPTIKVDDHHRNEPRGGGGASTRGTVYSLIAGKPCMNASCEVCRSYRL